MVGKHHHSHVVNGVHPVLHETCKLAIFTSKHREHMFTVISLKMDSELNKLGKHNITFIPKQANKPNIYQTSFYQSIIISNLCTVLRMQGCLDLIQYYIWGCHVPVGTTVFGSNLFSETYSFLRGDTISLGLCCLMYTLLHVTQRYILWPYIEVLMQVSRVYTGGEKSTE